MHARIEYSSPTEPCSHKLRNMNPVTDGKRLLVAGMHLGRK